MHILAARRPNLLRKLAALGLALVFLSLAASDASAQYRRGRGGFGRGFYGRGYGGVYGRGYGGFYRPQVYNRGYVGGNFGPRVYSRGYGGVYGYPYARPYVAPRVYGGMGYGGGIPY